MMQAHSAQDRATAARARTMQPAELALRTILAALLPLGLATFLRPFPLPQNRRSTVVAASIRRG
jgi:hypothetical protein